MADSRTVVGAAIVRDGRVLAARRSAPAELAGRWEFPGGKVEPGESEPDAVARECVEELGVTVMVGALIGRAAISADLELAVYTVSIASGEPSAQVTHDELRWLVADELPDVDWLEADRAVLPDIARYLSGSRLDGA